MASVEYERQHSDGNVTVQNHIRQGLHSGCRTKTTLVAVAAALICLSSSSPVALASTRDIPPSRAQHSGSPGKQATRLFSFLSQRNSRNDIDNGQPRRVPPSTASAPETASSLRFSASYEENNETHNLSTYDRKEADEETTVTTTSFFRFPSENTMQTQEPSEPERTSHLQRTPNKEQIQGTFVISLMGLAGFVEGFCIRRHGAFPNLMTGTILKVAEAIGKWNLSAASIHASMVGCYIGGSWIFSQWKKTAPITSNKLETKKSALLAVSVLSGLLLLLSDASGGFLKLPFFRLPLLAAAFGVINAGTVDVGAGVTYAMTGHVTKVGQGLVSASSNFARPEDPSMKPKAHRTSAQGLVAFSMAALVANLICGVLESNRISSSAPLLVRVAGTVLRKLPLGATCAVAYAWLFRWYLGALERASPKASEAKKGR